MKPRLRCGLLLSVLAIAGCGGGARLDATSMDTYTVTRKALETGMTDNQKRQLAKDFADALGPEAAQATLKNTFSKEKTTTSPIDIYKTLQGMTAEEIHLKAEENRNSRKKH
jgi:Family of unknown function (DUF6694)